MMGHRQGLASLQQRPELLGLVALRVDGADHLAPSVEVEHVAMAEEPVRPLEAEQRQEASRRLGACHGGPDPLPQRRRAVEKAQTEVVVVGERRHVERREVARVGEILLRRAAAVGERRVPVQVGPEDARGTAADLQRVRAEARVEILHLDHHARDAAPCRHRLEASPAPVLGSDLEELGKPLEPACLDHARATHEVGDGVPGGVERREVQPDRLSQRRPGGHHHVQRTCRAGQDVEGGLHVEGSRDAVAVAVHAQEELLVGLREAVGPGRGGTLAAVVDEDVAALGEGGFGHAHLQAGASTALGHQPHVGRIRLDPREARVAIVEGLGIAPVPERGDLHDQRAAVGDP